MVTWTPTTFLMFYLSKDSPKYFDEDCENYYPILAQNVVDDEEKGYQPVKGF